MKIRRCFVLWGTHITKQRGCLFQPLHPFKGDFALSGGRQKTPCRFAPDKCAEDIHITKQRSRGKLSLNLQLYFRRQLYNRMIIHSDISDFFDSEAKADRERWDALMRLPVAARVRKRKAIDSVFIERVDPVLSENGNKLVRLSFARNLSDFKEGESLVLHTEDGGFSVQCTLYGFEDDNAVMVEVFPRNLPEHLDLYYGRPMILDKAYVDMRGAVYNKFLFELSIQEIDWDNLILNTKASPCFGDRTAVEKVIEELEDSHPDLRLLSSQRNAIVNSLAAEDYYLIQGPPGTGKSFVLALIVLEEIALFGHKVMVVGPNHMAINNDLIKVVESCPEFLPAELRERLQILKIGQKYNAPGSCVASDEGEPGILCLGRIGENASEQLVDWVIGLTPHSLYTSRARTLTCDTLIIDEAGQMTIPLALMGMVRADKVIFAGDYRQLPPIVTSDEIVGEMKQSVFQALMTDDNCTMLDSSFRMCGPICRFVSELFYGGELKPVRQDCGSTVLCGDPLYSFDSPVVIHDVDDNGEQTSDKEAEFVAEVIAHYLGLGLAASDIAVLAPFRAQAANIRRAIRRHAGIYETSRQMIVVDTVDKMQGQEREVIVFSLAAGDIDYMTEMADFLYNPNKLNVAFSRAKSKLIIVGNVRNLKRISPDAFPHVRKMLDSDAVRYV